MSVFAALARIELDALSDPDRTCADALKDLDHISTLQEDGAGGAFEKSLRVKSTIDTLEAQVQEQPSWKVLAAITNSEYRLWRLNAGTPLRHNPFLSHWVEAVQRLEVEVVSGSGKAATHEVSKEDVAATRLEMIKGLLRGNAADELSTSTPRLLYDARHRSTPFDVQPFIRMLEEEGIYEPSPPTIPQAANHNSPNHAQKPTFQSWKQSLLSRLSTDPASAVHDLTHLPIALPALDFLTTLLVDHSLTTHAIDPAPLVTLYIQHALRLIEHMGQSPNPNVSPPHQTEIGIETTMDALDHGREAQSRAVRLLLLFISNLIRKGLVGVEVLYFEIQEICVRYVWIKEVREFRAWVEEGRGGDSEGG